MTPTVDVLTTELDDAPAKPKRRTRKPRETHRTRFCGCANCRSGEACDWRWLPSRTDGDNGEAA